MFRIFFIIFFNIVFAFATIGLPATSVVQITLSDSKTGLLDGNFPAVVKLIDHASNTSHWESNQTISFNNGFGEIILGPIANLNTIENPRVVVIIDENRLNFYPSVLFAIQKKPQIS